MVYESILKGLNNHLLEHIHVILTSDGKRDFYSDLSRLLDDLTDYNYFSVVVYKNALNHIHLLIRDCPYRLSWFDSRWHLYHGCIARKLPVEDAVSTAVYLATQESIDHVVLTGGWFN